MFAESRTLVATRCGSDFVLYKYLRVKDETLRLVFLHYWLCQINIKLQTEQQIIQMESVRRYDVFDIS